MPVTVIRSRIGDAYLLRSARRAWLSALPVMLIRPPMAWIMKVIGDVRRGIGPVQAEAGDGAVNQAAD